MISKPMNLLLLLLFLETITELLFSVVFIIPSIITGFSTGSKSLFVGEPVLGKPPMTTLLLLNW